MKIRLVVALVGSAISSVLPAFSQEKSLKELVVGTWLLDSVYDQTQDGEKHNAWGDSVKEQAIFTSDGHFSLQGLPRLLRRSRFGTGEGCNSHGPCV